MRIDILWRLKLNQSHGIVVLKTSHFKTQNVQCKFVLYIVRSDLEFTTSRFWIVRLQRVIANNKQSLQLKIQVFSLTTRMHSSRMHTARSSSHPGGLLHQDPPGADTPPPEQTPPRSRHPPEQTPPPSRHPPRSRHPPPSQEQTLSLLTESQMPVKI